MRNISLGSTQPNFRAEEFEVIDVRGSEVAARSKATGREYTRNRAHVKKFTPNILRNTDVPTHGSDVMDNPIDKSLSVVSTNKSEEQAQGHSEAEVIQGQASSSDDANRLRRQRNTPGKYKDFHLYQ